MTEVKAEIERQSRNRDRSSSTEEGQRLGTESRDRDRSRKEKVGPLQDLDLVLMLIPTGIDLDATDVVSMTTLQENANALTDEESGSESKEIDDSTWQMLSKVETSPFQDFDTQDLNM